MERNLCHLGVGDETTLVSLENIRGGCRVNVYRTRTSVEPVGASRAVAVARSLTSLQRGSSPKKSSPTGINYSSFLGPWNYTPWESRALLDARFLCSSFFFIFRILRYFFPKVTG